MKPSDVAIANGRPQAMDHHHHRALALYDVSYPHLLAILSWKATGYRPSVRLLVRFRRRSPGRPHRLVEGSRVSA